MAIKEIVDQGEGSAQIEYAPDGGLAHYWKFSQIVDGSIPFRASDVYPLVSDPKVADLPDGPVRDLAQFFNDGYGLLLRALTKIYNEGDGCELVRHGALFTLMDRVLRPAAVALAETPIPGGEFHAGPSFELSTTAPCAVAREAAALAARFPLLQGVPAALSELPSID